MLRRAIERRAVTNESPADMWARDFLGFASRKTFSGKAVTQESALGLIAVMSCVSLIADGISTLPIDEYRKVGQKRELVPASSRWIDQPNPFQTSQDFWHRVITSMALDGNAFLATVRRDNGVVAALYVLDPQLVTIEELPGAEVRYHYNGEIYDRSQILHIPMFTLAGRPRGLSPIEVAREAVGLGLTAEEFGARFFAQGTTMAGVIEHPATPKPDEAKMLREMFRKTHAGTKNSHAVGVLTGGAVFKPITLSPEQAQFLETRRFQKHEIALLYHIPIYMVDPTVTSSWGSGIEEQNKGLIDYALMPYIVRIEQAISTFLLGGNRRIKFNLDAKLRPKTKERYEAYQIAVNNGWMNLDEVRALEDLEPIPGGLGQDFYRPLNNVYALGQPLPEPSAANPVDGDLDENGKQDSTEGTIPKKRSEELHIHVEPQINVAAPEVRVNPAIEVKQPNLTVAPARSRRIERDEQGEITRIIEE